MKGKNPPIMAIHPTTRGFGYVVMSGPFSLTDWGTVAATKHKNATCLARLTKLLDRYDPHAVVLEDPTQEKRRSGRINNLCKAVAALCHSRSIDLAAFSRADMFRCYATVGAKHWQDIAEAVARQHEPLRKLIPSRRKAWQSEARRMSIFAAAAIAMTYWQLADACRTDFV
jgi:hypothetical protein